MMASASRGKGSVAADKGALAAVKDAGSSDDINALAAKYEMTVVECTSALPHPDRSWEATLSIHGKHEFTIKKAPGSGFTCSTRDDFLGDNLWLENLEEAVSVANGVETVLKEALGVYK
eukprot:TRINITY_DN11310_c0_g1_i2.p2 TRINITY_DN11310_c0_g1~~TRINITY_DN11310_c0_g1_i2.p2  ORF type:complete len:119 (-),score=24.48 TRINITY_DN11310_c0_g1_i2:367-723(-)